MSIWLFIISVFFPGLAIAGYLSPRYLTLGRAFAIAYPIGTAIVSFELFIYFVIARLSFSPVVFWFFALQTLVAAVYLMHRIWKQRQLSVQLQAPKPLVWLLSSLIAVILIFSLVQALAKPSIAYDSLGFWALRAKILLHDAKVDFNPNSQTYLSAYSSRNYPWHLSLLEYWIRKLGVSGSPVNIISWFYFLSLVMLLLDVMARRNRVRGLFLTLVFCSQPLIFYHASNNYADLAIAAYIVSGFVFFLDWLETKRLSQLLLAATFLSWTICVKNYGIFFIISLVVALIVTMILKRQKFSVKSGTQVAAALIVPLLPLALFKIFFRLNLRNATASWGWHPETLRALGEMMFVANSWNIWWLAFICMSLILIPQIYRQRTLSIAWSFFLTTLVLIIASYLFTENYQWALDQTNASRSFISLVPLSILLLNFSFRHTYDTTHSV